MNSVNIRRVFIFIICVFIPIAVGMVSGYLTRNNMSVFDTISKPELTPPAIVFPIAWSILYLLMGMASFFAYINCNDIAHRFYILFPYVIQLALNFLWSIIFFNMQAYGLAFVCLVFMWIMVIRTMMFFNTVSSLGFWLLVPYILWITFAGYLNLSIVMME